MDTNILGILIGIASFIVTVVIFFYQERKERIKQTRESQLLTEDIITQIIRNSTQQKISFLEINIEYLLEGFTKLKNTHFNYKLIELLKMIYEKIYENDFIVKSDKVSILNELELKIDEINKRKDMIVEEDCNNKYLSIVHKLLKVYTILCGCIFVSLSIIKIFIFKEIQNITDFINDTNILITLVASIIFLMCNIILYVIERTERKNHMKNIVKLSEIESIYNDIFEANTSEIKVSNDEKSIQDIGCSAIISESKKNEQPVGTEQEKENDISEDKDSSHIFEWSDTSEDKRIRECLGEVVLIRMFIEKLVFEAGNKYCKENIPRRNVVYILRKLMQLISESERTDDEKKSRANEVYKNIRKNYDMLNDILHYNDNHFIPNKQYQTVLRNEIKQNLTELLDIAKMI